MHYEYTNKRFVSLITKFNESETPGFHQFKMLARYDDNVSIYRCLFSVKVNGLITLNAI